MLHVVVTGAYYPLAATTGAYYAQNGEIREGFTKEKLLFFWILFKLLPPPPPPDFPDKTRLLHQLKIRDKYA